MKPTYVLAVVTVVIASVIAAGPAAVATDADGQVQQQVEAPEDVTVSNATVLNLTTSLTIEEMEMNLTASETNTSVNVTLSDARMNVQDAWMLVEQARLTDDGLTIENGSFSVENATVSVASATVESNGMTSTIENETVSIENETMEIDNRTFSIEDRTTDVANDLLGEDAEETTDDRGELFERLGGEFVLHSMTIEGLSADLALENAMVSSVDWGDHSANGFANDVTSSLENTSVTVDNATIDDERLALEEGIVEVDGGDASLGELYLSVDQERRAFVDRSTTLDEQRSQVQDVLLPFDALMERLEGTDYESLMDDS